MHIYILHNVLYFKLNYIDVTLFDTGSSYSTFSDVRSLLGSGLQRAPAHLGGEWSSCEAHCGPL